MNDPKLSMTTVWNVYYTSIKIIKNEVGCRDDTVPKTVDTRRHCEEEREHATIFRNPQKLRFRDWVAENCCMLSLLLAVPSCIYSFGHGVIPTSYFIFILVSLIFYPGLALTVARGEMILLPVPARSIYALAFYVRTRMRIVRAK